MSKLTFSSFINFTKCPVVTPKQHNKTAPKLKSKNLGAFCWHNSALKHFLLHQRVTVLCTYPFYFLTFTINNIIYGAPTHNSPERLQRHKDIYMFILSHTLYLSLSHTNTHTPNTCITGDGLVQWEETLKNHGHTNTTAVNLLQTLHNKPTNVQTMFISNLWNMLMQKWWWRELRWMQAQSEKNTADIVCPTCLIKTFRKIFVKSPQTLLYF